MKKDRVYRAQVRQYEELTQMSHTMIQDLFDAAADLRPKAVRECVLEFLRQAERGVLCAQYAARKGLPLDQMQDKEMDALLEQCVIQGHMEVVGVDEKGETHFRLTERGKLYVENMIGSRRH